MSVNGALTVEGLLGSGEAINLNGPLEVEGLQVSQIQVNQSVQIARDGLVGGSFQVSGNLTVGGNLSVGGSLRAQEVSIEGRLLQPSGASRMVSELSAESQEEGPVPFEAPCGCASIRALIGRAFDDSAGQVLEVLDGASPLELNGQFRVNGNLRLSQALVLRASTPSRLVVAGALDMPSLTVEGPAPVELFVRGPFEIGTLENRGALEVYVDFSGTMVLPNPVGRPIYLSAPDTEVLSGSTAERRWLGSLWARRVAVDGALRILRSPP